jgi:MFS family permease
VGGAVVEQYGVQASFLCVSAAAVVTLLLYLFLPETIQTTGDKRDVGEDNKTVATEVALLGPTEAVDSKKESLAAGDWDLLLQQKSWRGLAICQCGASFGFAAKVAAVPVLATAALPGGAAGAGALLSAAGLSGIVGAPVGGWLTDRTSAKSTAVLSGLVSAAGLLLIPFALATSGDGEFAVSVFGVNLGFQAAAFSASVILWSLGASSQGPALTAFAQELAPVGAEATAMALPRATGDGTYIVAPFLLGLVTDSAVSQPGAECAFAGVMTLLGAVGLALLGNDVAPKSVDKQGRR